MTTVIWLVRNDTIMPHDCVMAIVDICDGEVRRCD